MNEDIFQVEQIEAISFDENGQEDETWEGWSVTLIDQPSKYCFDCRDKFNADELCDFLNKNMRATSINAPVMDNLTEWSCLVTELSSNEIELYNKKEDYNVSSEKLLEDAAKEKAETDYDVIKEKYGGNNDKTRKKYVKDALADEAMELKQLEWSIDYIKRRISFLKQLIHTKTVLSGIKE